MSNTINNLTIRETALFYIGYGFEPIPLQPNSKEPLLFGWNIKLINRQWDLHLENCNIGLRCGGENNLVVIDCDNKNNSDTFSNIISYLREKDIPFNKCPLVQTASGSGRHIYIRTDKKISGNMKTFKSEYGAGELRFGTSVYVVSPPSVINNNPYQLISGDIKNIPVIEWTKLSLLVESLEILFSEKYKLPRLAKRLLESDELFKYKSRSEKEAAILTSLIDNGFSDKEIQEIFSYYKPPKYNEKYLENRSSAKSYLETSIRNSKRFISSGKNPNVFSAIEQLKWAENNKWNRLSDKAVYMAHCEIMKECGKDEYHASCRDLGLKAGVGIDTASRANKRLIDQGLINLISRGYGNFANEYRIINNRTLIKNTPVDECPNFSINHDVFRWGFLNKSGYEIYTALLREPLTINQILKTTSIKSKRTIITGLKKMNNIVDLNTGENHQMVFCEKGIWNANNIDLDVIAKCLVVNGYGENKAKKYEEERKIFNYNRRIKIMSRILTSSKITLSDKDNKLNQNITYPT